MNNSAVLVDATHLGRAVTGLERITEELFLSDENVYAIKAKNKAELLLKQIFMIPALGMRTHVTKIIFSGFPPSPLATILCRDKIVHYVHDLFLKNNPEVLNAFAKWYMRPSFLLSLKLTRQFLVNSEWTYHQLSTVVKPSSIDILRPRIRDVFDLSATDNRTEVSSDHFHVVTVGTVEPRKNLVHAADTCDALSRLLNKPVTFHIFGRRGWGDDWSALKDRKGVVLHGYTDMETIKISLSTANLYLSLSSDEGLGLPLLEVQHGGLTVAAANIPAYQEVLGTSGVMVPSADATSSAEIILNHLLQISEAERNAAAKRNVARWNRLANADKARYEASVRKKRNFS